LWDKAPATSSALNIAILYCIELKSQSIQQNKKKIET
jgi:hypothetical protein